MVQTNKRLQVAFWAFIVVALVAAANFDPGQATTTTTTTTTWETEAEVRWRLGIPQVGVNE